MKRRDRKVREEEKKDSVENERGNKAKMKEKRKRVGTRTRTMEKKNEEKDNKHYEEEKESIESAAVIDTEGIELGDGAAEGDRKGGAEAGEGEAAAGGAEARRAEAGGAEARRAGAGGGHVAEAGVAVAGRSAEEQRGEAAECQLTGTPGPLSRHHGAREERLDSIFTLSCFMKLFFVSLRQAAFLLLFVTSTRASLCNKNGTATGFLAPRVSSRTKRF